MLSKCLLLIFILFNTVLAADTDPRTLMVSPSDNSFFEIRDRPRDLKIVFNRPDPKLRYKLEIVLNGRKIVDHFTEKDTFKVRLGRYDQELKWRVQALDQDDNVVLANDFVTVKVYHNERFKKIDLEVDRHSLKDKLIVTWVEQEECDSYVVQLGSKKIVETRKLGVLLNETSSPVTIKVSCSEDLTHYGQVELAPKKILSSSLLYEFHTVALWFKQEVDTSASSNSSNENYLMQVHGLGWQLHWDKRKRNDVTTYLRYGRMLTFDDEAELMELDIRFRFDFGHGRKEKLLIEYEGQRLSYDFADKISTDQDMSFLNAGFETFFQVRNKVVKSAFLLKKELTTFSFTPAFKFRFSLPYTRNFSWIAEFDYSNFKSEIDTSELSGDTNNTLTQFKAGLSYLFW